MTGALRVVRSTGDDSLARVFVGELEDGSLVECVEAVQPPVPREAKWVLIVSTLKGCPVGCPICDAGGSYRGRLTADEIMAQVEYLVRLRYPDGVVPVPTGPGLVICPGIIPTFDFPGLMMPGQFGPMSLAPFSLTMSSALPTSWTGTPSEMQTMVFTPASAASNIASAAKALGT